MPISRANSRRVTYRSATGAAAALI
jgi:hypothetical protein